MDLGLKGKTALVTGASSHGIGRAIAKSLAAEGVHLCISARRCNLLDKLAEEIAADGSKRPYVVAVDLLREEGPTKLALQALAELGSINILINSVGHSSGRFPIDSPEEMWEREFNLNFTCVRKLTLAVVPDMIKHNWGRIVSITGRSEPPRMLYGTTAPKAALHGFSKALSNEVGKNGITGNCIAPGKIMSEQIRLKYNERERKRFAEDEIRLAALQSLRNLRGSRSFSPLHTQAI